MLLLLLCLLQDDGAKAYQEGRYAEAAAFYERSAAPEGQVMLGRCRLQLKDWKGAAAAFQAALAKKADLGADVHRALGQAFVMAGGLDEGIKSLRRAERADPQDVDILWISRALVQKGAYAAAELEVSRLAGSTEGEELLAWLLARRGRHVEAAELYRGLLRRAPGTAKHWAALGQEEAAAGREAEAVVALDAARRLGKLDGPGLRLLADLCLRGQLYREAAEAYAAVPAPSAEDLLRLGHARLQAGEPVSAREAFEKALAAEPEKSDAALQLGRLAKSPAEARRYFAQAKAHAALGELELREGRAEEAVAAFDAALKGGDRSAAAHYHLVLALRQAKRDELPALREGLREHPLDERLRALLRTK